MKQIARLGARQVGRPIGVITFSGERTYYQSVKLEHKSEGVDPFQKSFPYINYFFALHLNHHSFLSLIISFV